MTTDLNKKTFFLISGASRGIGKTMAIECSKKFKSGSVLVLIARSLTGLEATKSEILSSTQGLTVLIYSVDLSTANSSDYEQLLAKSLKDSSTTAGDFEQAFVIHNAGTIGDVSIKSRNLNDVNQWDRYLRTNVSSAANVPFASFTEYCTGKAARQMYFKVLAAEEKETLVLNYSPGPVETDMTVDVQKNSHDSGVRGMFENLRSEKTILTTEQTTAKFLQVLEKNQFQSGDQVDFYD
uniref:Sepiapterin reductase n=1 Tax=Megaselia scalaris TaxID=36166 RepID=T1GT79_MEGSC